MTRVVGAVYGCRPAKQVSILFKVILNTICFIKLYHSNPKVYREYKLLIQISILSSAETLSKMVIAETFEAADH